MTEPLVFTGQSYRIIPRAWAHDPLSGEGARRHGGRYNPRGMPAFYCALDPHTAYAEYTASLFDRPGWLCSFDITTAVLLDLTLAEHRAIAGLSEDELTLAWKDHPNPPSQTIARKLVASGIDGLIYVSRHHPPGRNMVLWTADTRPILSLRDRLGETIIDPIPN